MNNEIKEIIQDRLDDEIEELIFLKYRESLGWKNKIPFYGLPMSMDYIKEKIKSRKLEIKRIQLLLPVAEEGEA